MTVTPRRHSPCKLPRSSNHPPCTLSTIDHSQQECAGFLFAVYSRRSDLNGNGTSNGPSCRLWPGHRIHSGYETKHCPFRTNSATNNRLVDRLYLASYAHPPDENTPFPYPAQARRSPHKKSSRAETGPTPAILRPPPVYFTIDDTLLYNAFHADFGPLHIGHLYRFAVQFHEILGDPANNDKAVVFWSRADSRSRANAACLVACYMVLIQAWPPHLALAPIAQADPPYMPFRDAGYSQADFILNIQDVVYGVWKAKEENLCQLKEFNLEEYVSEHTRFDPY